MIVPSHSHRPLGLGLRRCTQLGRFTQMYLIPNADEIGSVGPTTPSVQCFLPVLTDFGYLVVVCVIPLCPQYP